MGRLPRGDAAASTTRFALAECSLSRARSLHAKSSRSQESSTATGGTPGAGPRGGNPDPGWNVKEDSSMTSLSIKLAVTLGISMLGLAAALAKTELPLGEASIPRASPRVDPQQAPRANVLAELGLD